MPAIGDEDRAALQRQFGVAQFQPRILDDDLGVPHLHGRGGVGGLQQGHAVALGFGVAERDLGAVDGDLFRIRIEPRNDAAGFDPASGRHRDLGQGAGRIGRHDHRIVGAAGADRRQLAVDRGKRDVGGDHRRGLGAAIALAVLVARLVGAAGLVRRLVGGGLRPIDSPGRENLRRTREKLHPGRRGDHEHDHRKSELFPDRHSKLRNCGIDIAASLSRILRRLPAKYEMQTTLTPSLPPVYGNAAQRYSHRRIKFV